MKTSQISVFLENRAGRLAEVTAILCEAGINLRALSLADTTDFGILRIIVQDCTKAQKALKEKGFTVSVNSVVAVAVPDQPGGLNGILQIMNKAGINVEYMYAFATKNVDTAVMVFRFDKADEAIELLQKAGIAILSPEALYA